MPWIRNKITGETVFVEDTPSPAGVPIGPQDPTREPKAQADTLRAQNQAAASQYDPAMAQVDLRLKQQQAQEAYAREQRDRLKFQTDMGAVEARGGVDTTEAERTAAFLATRVAGGIQQLGRIKGRDVAPTYWEKIASGSDLGNYATNEERQRINAAQLDILDAALTLGTGAAYTQEQLEGYRRSYFPQPGDKAGTIKDKTGRLQLLLESARVKAGGASQFIDRAIEGSGVFGAAPTNIRDGGEYDQQGNLIGLAGNVSAEPPAQTPAPPTPDTPEDYRNSYLGQGMSGLNEGIASALGAPVDLATMGMNLVPQGINAVANTRIPQINDPIGGSEWIKDRMSGWGTYGATNDPSKQFVRRAGQSVGAAAVPVGATGSLAQLGRGLAMSAGGGVGAAAAQQAFPGNPVAEFTGEVLGSGLTATGLIGSSRRAAMQEAMKQVPTRDELRDQATNLYNTAESRGIVAGPNVTGNLAGRFQKIADDEKLRWPNGKVDPNYTRAGAALDMIDAHAGQSIDPRQIQVMRDNLMDSVMATQGKERRISRKMLEAFDEETVPLAPELAQARKVSSRYLQSDQINKARDLAEPRAAQFSGSGMENALRTEFRKLDRGIINGTQNFNPAVEQSINNVTRGTPYSNAMRTLGKAAPTGPVSAGISTGVPFAIGNALGGPAVGAGASAATLGLGMFGRSAATKAVEKEAAMADILARNGGALDVPPLVDEETRRAMERALAGQGTQYLPRY